MGKPGRAKLGHFSTEYIGLGERTRRTETSKYPEEKKTIAISQVAASERESAQTSAVSATLGL